jgi:Concanavalin A-like lectin/glucanases superfamily
MPASCPKLTRGLPLRGTMELMRWLFVLLAGGCYAAAPPSGAPCDPGAPRCPTGQVCVAATCQPEGTTPGLDAPISGDAMQAQRACPSDSDLLVCLSFDPPGFVSPLANEGILPLAASFTNVTRTSLGAGGAAVFTTASTMLFPPSTTITGVLAAEVTLRLDAAPPAMSRVGIVDTDVSGAGISLFIYAGSPDRISCTLGADPLLVDAAIALGTWTTIGCSCEADRTVIRRDGVMLGSAAGCAPGSAETFGVQIGQNSRGAQPPNEPFVGAIDRVRLWKRVPQ